MPGEPGEPACCGAPVSSSRCAWAGTSWRSPAAERSAAPAGRGAGERNSFMGRRGTRMNADKICVVIGVDRRLSAAMVFFGSGGVARGLGEELGRETHSWAAEEHG